MSDKTERDDLQEDTSGDGHFEEVGRRDFMKAGSAMIL